MALDSLPYICSEHHLTVTNTLFQLKNKYKTMWQHPLSGHSHQLDHIIVHQADRKEVLITRVMRSAECWTDHRLIHSKIRLEVRPQQRRQLPPRKLNISALKDPILRASLRCKIAEALSSIPHGLTPHPSETTYIVPCTKPHIRADVQRHLRCTENDWWKERTLQIQQYADSNDIHDFYDAVKTIYGPVRRGKQPIRSSDGNILYKNNEEIISRWGDHFNNLLNQSNSATPNILDQLPNLPILQEMDRDPQLAELIKAVRKLKNNKSPEPDGIPVEVFMEGGYALRLHLTELLQEVIETTRHNDTCAGWPHHKDARTPALTANPVRQLAEGNRNVGGPKTRSKTISKNYSRKVT
ncbi:uncharacterized protein LOC143033659 [Oratosquilla oratoria]|uniref:uncharacterized protein LOC143033659 n=1 Tax=Oratosquilla oratoria TaxID=337810 RepID=UPI003F75D6B1